MKITVYTVSDCQFSQKEKEYLKAHNLPFEEKNLEQNRDWLTEMLAVSNNFAGTPVTKIEKDDGTIVVLKGFTPEEFDEALGFKKEEVAQANAQMNVSEPANVSPSPPPPPSSIPPTPQTPPPTTNQPTQQPTPPSSSTPSTPQTPPTTNQPENQPLEQPPQPTPQSPTTNVNDPLSSVLQNLQTKANPQPENPTPDENPQTSGPLPNIPDPDFK